MKKIIVPTDFSVNAYNAFAYALSFAAEIDATISLLHVVALDMDIVDLPIPSGAAYRVKKEAAEAAMQAQIELAKSHDPGNIDTLTTIETFIKVGSAVDQINATSSEIKADLIIMGARGAKKSNLEKWIGTRSSDMATHSSLPVLIVPEGASFKPIVQLAYAADLRGADAYELWSTLQLIKPFSPVVRYVHVSYDSNEEESQRVEKMRAYIEAQNPALQLIFHQVYGKNIDEGIAEFCKTYEIDLLVVFHQPKNIFQRIFGSSHTKHLVSKLEIPMLVISS